MDFSILQSLFGETKSEKIQRCIHSFIISSSITSNKEYIDNMREFINKIMAKSELSVKNIDKLYENIDETVIRLINKYLNVEVRKGIIEATQRGDMTEKEVDVIGRFNMVELIESIFHMYTYRLFQDVKRSMNSLITLIDITRIQDEQIRNLYDILANMINSMNDVFRMKYEEESHKVFYHIIMTDEHLTILKKYISALLEMVLKETYRIVNSYILNNQ